MIVAPAISRATVVYSNLGVGNSSNIDGNVVGNDLAADNLAQADTFTPAANYTLTNVQLALSCPVAGTCPDNYTVEILSDLAGFPNTSSVLFSASEAGTALLGASTTSLVTIPTTISVLSGVSYWIVVLNPSGNDRIQWNWNTKGDASAEATAFAGGGLGDTYYELGSTPNAYAVNGTVVTSSTPEPGTLAMMLGGGLLLGFLRKVRR